MASSIARNALTARKVRGLNRNNSILWSMCPFVRFRLLTPIKKEMEKWSLRHQYLEFWNVFKCRLVEKHVIYPKPLKHHLHSKQCEPMELIALWPNKICWCLLCRWLYEFVHVCSMIGLSSIARAIAIGFPLLPGEWWKRTNKEPSGRCARARERPTRAAPANYLNTHQPAQTKRQKQFS